MVVRRSETNVITEGVWLNGRRHRSIGDKAIATAEPRHAITLLLFIRFSVNQFGLRYTVVAPAVIPNIAVDTVKNAR